MTDSGITVDCTGPAKLARRAPEVLIGCLVGGHQPGVEAAEATHKPEEDEREDHERNGGTTLACRTQQQQRRRRQGQEYRLKVSA